MQLYQSINPFSILGLSQISQLDFYQIKNNFRCLSLKHTQNIEQRILINISYDCLSDQIFASNKRYKKTKNKYTISDPKDIIFLILTNNLQEVNKYYQKHKQQINSLLSIKFSALYVACRVGHQQMVQCLLAKGAKFIIQQKSTPMHAAYFYGHKNIISLLYKHGFQGNRKNDEIQYNGRFPIQQIQSESEIYKVHLILNQDPILNLMNQLKQNQLVIGKLIQIQKEINNNKKVVCKRIVNSLYQQNKHKYLKQQYQNCYHGTKFKHIQSIFKQGLKPVGFKLQQQQKQIVLQSGRIPLDQSNFGIKNWAKAVFLTPSIFYASDPVYSQLILSNNQNYSVIIEAKVKKDCYTKHPHTLMEYEYKLLEPKSLQFRVPTEKFDIYLSDGCQPVIVVSYLNYIKSYEQLKNLIDQFEEKKKIKIKIKNSIKIEI